MLFPSLVNNVQMCAESCKGISKRVGLDGGNTCTCLRDDRDLTRDFGGDWTRWDCNKPCDIHNAMKDPVTSYITCGK